MTDPKSSTMDQLRRQIGSDGSSNSMAPEQPAPAASPLGTDDEAGGTTPTPERIEMARKAEDRIRAAAAKKQSAS